MGGTRHTIGIDMLDRFSIDDDLILYWDGETVQTMSKYSMPWWQQVMIAGGSVGAIIAAIATVGIFLQGTHWFG
jgi:hypothetical protein